MEPTDKSESSSTEEIEVRLSRAARLADKVKGLVRDLTMREEGGEEPSEAETPGAPPAETAAPDTGTPEPPSGDGKGETAPSAPAATLLQPFLMPARPPAPDRELSLQIFVARQNIVRLASLADSPVHDLHQISRLLNGEILHLCQLLGQGSESALQPPPPEERRPDGQLPLPS
jgi:hypothetical protein